MKRVSRILTIALLVTAGCNGGKQSTDGFLTVDVTKNYSSTKELVLQDFMDVEYVKLETDDQIVNQGFVQAVGKNIILIKNHVDDGDIFVFHRNGKKIRKINRKGKGGEEYVSVSGIVLDEEHYEMFVNDNASRRILVYDLEGTFKRSFRHKENAAYRIYNFDRENLICQNFSSSNTSQSFYIISKQDGDIQEIQIPFKEKKTIVISVRDEAKDVMYRSKPSDDYPMVPYGDSWILTESSSDTVYQYFSDRHMVPFLVRSPSIQSMNPEVFLFLSVVTDRYYFMHAVTKDEKFLTDYLVYDQHDKSISKYVVYNDDYSDKKEVYLRSPLNSEVAFWHRLNAEDLVEAYEKGQLKGRLKEIAATLHEEDNPVIMLVKHKKMTE